VIGHFSANLDVFVERFVAAIEDRKSTRLNSSHGSISYAVFCLKKKRLHRDQARESDGGLLGGELGLQRRYLAQRVAVVSHAQDAEARALSEARACRLRKTHSGR